MTSLHPQNRCYSFYFINKETETWGIGNLLKLDNKVVALALKPGLMLFTIPLASERFHIGGLPGIVWCSPQKSRQYGKFNYLIENAIFINASQIYQVLGDRVIQKQISKFQHLKQNILKQHPKKFLSLSIMKDLIHGVIYHHEKIKGNFFKLLTVKFTEQRWLCTKVKLIKIMFSL